MYILGIANCIDIIVLYRIIIVSRYNSNETSKRFD